MLLCVFVRLLACHLDRLLQQSLLIVQAYRANRVVVLHGVGFRHARFDRVYPLVAISSVGRRLMEVARSSLEYMSDHLVKVCVCVCGGGAMKRHSVLCGRDMQACTLPQHLAVANQPLVASSENCPLRSTQVDHRRTQSNILAPTHPPGRPQSFELSRNNPLALRCAQLVSSPAQLTQLPPGPKVVLAGSASLDQGPARRLLLDWAAEERHTICFVQRPRVRGGLCGSALTCRLPLSNVMTSVHSAVVPTSYQRNCVMCNVYDC